MELMRSFLETCWLGWKETGMYLAQVDITLIIPFVLFEKLRDLFAKNAISEIQNLYNSATEEINRMNDNANDAYKDSLRGQLVECQNSAKKLQDAIDSSVRSSKSTATKWCWIFLLIIIATMITHASQYLGVLEAGFLVIYWFPQWFMGRIKKKIEGDRKALETSINLLKTLNRETNTNDLAPIVGQMNKITGDSTC